eukprot:RCo038959
MALPSSGCRMGLVNVETLAGLLREVQVPDCIAVAARILQAEPSLCWADLAAATEGALQGSGVSPLKAGRVRELAAQRASAGRAPGIRATQEEGLAQDPVPSAPPLPPRATSPPPQSPSPCLSAAQPLPVHPRPSLASGSTISSPQGKALACPEGCTLHRLQPGDTLTGLAVANSCSVASIKELNGLRFGDLDSLPMGSTLRIPRGTSPSPLPSLSASRSSRPAGASLASSGPSWGVRYSSGGGMAASRPVPVHPAPRGQSMSLLAARREEARRVERRRREAVVAGTVLEAVVDVICALVSNR